MAEQRVVFSGMGVLVPLSSPEQAQPILGVQASSDNSKLTVLDRNGEDVEYTIDDLTQWSFTDRMEFVSEGVEYRIRRPRGEDGLWLSKYAISLPTEALRAFTKRGEKMDAAEDLVAYATEDSPHIVALVYTNDMGQWVRVSGDWVLMASDDESHAGMSAFKIDSNSAEDFVDLFDRNWVTVTDAQQYQSAESVVNPTSGDSDQ